MTAVVPSTINTLEELSQELTGDLYTDYFNQVLYATDASVYRALPQAVAIPKTVADLRLLIDYANKQNTSLIPRAAGTSLAGQCVGEGIVVDISKHFTRILEFNADEHWVRVQPGVVRDELNAFLRPYGYFFSPITSTANRAMLGGMVGNNSSGTTSIEFGTTRDKVIELKVLLSDGSVVDFGPITKEAFAKKCELSTLEGQLYQQIATALSNKAQQERIRQEFPKPSIHRRNTGYAIDALLDTVVFSDHERLFNFCELLCGSEGTLAFITEIKVKVDRLPPPIPVVLAVHFDSIHASMLATQIAMRHRPSACELMDKIILDCTKENLTYRESRFFIEGDPAAVLMVEFRGEDELQAQQRALALAKDLRIQALGYAFPVIPTQYVKQVWTLRSAGLGLLANIPGDAKAVACIEDTAVDLADLPDYIAEFSELMKRFNQQPVYYAHAGAGELHLRPILDLKQQQDVEQFYEISLAVAKLVKKYRGSLSGEHGDGRVRAAFIPLMVGEENYALFRSIKNVWDPKGIFNPGKIVDAPLMNTSLRYAPEQETRSFDTQFNFSDVGGIMRMAEKCNGSGDCRKLPLSGGTMCPSYQATRNERDTTRARANMLREFLTQSDRLNAFDHQELKEVMDLCLSCKGCTSECPSNVDMASLKAEFLHQYYQSNGIPLRAKAFAYIERFNALGSIWPGLYNFLLSNKWISAPMKYFLGVAAERQLPTIHQQTLRAWYEKTFQPQGKNYRQQVYLFCDEFTNYNDTPIGQQTVELLDRLGYEVLMIPHPESGRAAISKGLLPRAKALAEEQVSIFSACITAQTPLLGIEPSAILSFRDEYPRLVGTTLEGRAKKLAPHCMLIDEFLAGEIEAGHISSEAFTKEPKHVLLHGHCHQKSLSTVSNSAWLLSLPENYVVETIPSGCCGMAGSFGYEAEHYAISQQVGELVVFPAVRKAAIETIIVAPGTSCRHQIKDGTGRKVLHPVEVLRAALQ